MSEDRKEVVVRGDVAVLVRGRAFGAPMALADELGEVGSEVRVSEAPEVPLASETRPLGEDGER